MRKELSYVIEVAPSAMICPLKPSINAPRLETIAEESADPKFYIAINRKTLLFLPIFLSFASYLVVNSYKSAYMMNYGL